MVGGAYQEAGGEAARASGRASRRVSQYRPGVADPLLVHRQLLESWRRVMDLVGPGPIDEHFVDADAAVSGLEASGAWLDLGSGAGFPGFALAVHWPAAQVTMVERRQKRCAFLREVIAQAGLQNVTLVEGDSALLPRGAWQGVISRAYKPPPAFLAEAATLLAPGGLAVVLTAGDDPPPDPAFAAHSQVRYTVMGKARTATRYLRLG
jgi:16S rRNA G527 N7-methylase RsmG